MKERPADRGERTAMGRIAHAAPARRTAVEVVADDRVPVRGKMDADLMRAAGFRRQLEVRGGGRESRERAVTGPRGFSIGAGLHAAPVLRVAAERILEDALRRRRMAPDQGAVGLVRAAVLERQGERAMGRLAAGEEDDPRGADVEAMDEEELRVVWLAAGVEKPPHRLCA